MKIALGVGSRGITNLKEIVKAALGVLIEAGARPFIVPAMGSHGGATAEGQIEMLAELRSYAESMGVPIEASMEVTKDRHGVRRPRRRLQCSGVCSRRGGGPESCQAAHRLSGNVGQRHPENAGDWLRQASGRQQCASAPRPIWDTRSCCVSLRETILGDAPIFCGIALVEDQHHQTADDRGDPTGEHRSRRGQTFSEGAVAAGAPAV